ncbi:MAG: glycosyltransferase [Actinomycetota bacterium]|nr:glycosyltransferase [Actinomycetota bacterium]
MRISFFGSSLVSSYWNGACTYYRGIIRALNELGHEVTFYEPIAYERQEHRDIDDPPWATVVIYPAEAPADVLSTVERAAGSDVVVKTSGVGVFDELLEESVLTLGSASTTTIFWDVDAPATLGRMEADPSDGLRSLIPVYDIVFTYGGGDPVVARYEALGARRCVPVYNGLDPTTHHPVEPEPRFEADLSFLGNRLPDREARVDEFFFRAASLQPTKTFLLGGSGWDTKSFSDNVDYIGHVSTIDHNAFNCSPGAVLNVSRDSMATNGFSPATRVFEACGAGACLITDYWEGIDHFLEPDSEVLVAHDGEEVAEIVSALDVAAARRVGEAARRRVLRDHTYASRAAQVMEILEGRLAPSGRLHG